MVIPWFALQTRARHEKQVARSLDNRGYETLVPLYRKRRQWSDRVVEVMLPLFQMYVFCRFNPSALGKAISTPGVTRVVGFGGKAIEVGAEEIKALQLLSESSLLREPWTYIPHGTVVRVETGPLAGMQGIFCSGDDRQRLIISVTLLQRSVAVQLDEDTVLSMLEGPKRDKNREVVMSRESDLALKLMTGL